MKTRLELAYVKLQRAYLKRERACARWTRVDEARNRARHDWDITRAEFERAANAVSEAATETTTPEAPAHERED